MKDKIETGASDQKKYKSTLTKLKEVIDMFSRKMFVFVAVVVLFSAWLGGCYTVLQHPNVASRDVGQVQGVEKSKYCTDCHSNFYYNSYYHNPLDLYDPFWLRRPFYNDYFGSYYNRWEYYSYTPWWWDDYYNYRYRREADPDNTKTDEPKVKRDWDRREGFGGGTYGGTGGTYSGSSTSGESKVTPPMASPSNQNGAQVGETRSRTTTDTKQEVKKEEKKDEKPQRRKDMN